LRMRSGLLEESCIKFRVECRNQSQDRATFNRRREASRHLATHSRHRFHLIWDTSPFDTVRQIFKHQWSDEYNLLQICHVYIKISMKFSVSQLLCFFKFHCLVKKLGQFTKLT
jgi:hypothetical protein